MLYFLYGDNEKARVSARNKLLERLAKEHGDITLERLDGEGFLRADIHNLLSGNDLFGRTRVILLAHIREDNAANELCISRSEDLSSSRNIYIWSEASSDAKTVTAIKKHGGDTQEFSSGASKKEKKATRANLFPLANALGARDRKKAWVILQKALKEGVTPEEIHGILFWQVKALLLIHKNGGEETGLNPFVEQKARVYAQRYTDSELEELSSQLFTIYHEARRGKTELPIALEKFVLSF